MSTAGERGGALRANARAVQRRGALQRIEERIVYYEQWARAIEQGRAIGRHEPDDPPLNHHDHQQLVLLRQERERLLRQMADEGQR